MRENEKNRNMADDRKHITKPIFIASVVFAALIGFLIWLTVSYPKATAGLRDLLITLTAFLFFVIGAVLTVLCFFLSSRIDVARDSIDSAMTQADGKIEELADKITEILRGILNPVIEEESHKAGLLHLFSRKKTEDK